MSKHLDWFVADKKLSQDVSEYMRCVIWRKEINLRYSKQIEALRDSIEGLKLFEGSVLADTIPQRRAEYLERIVELEAERDKLIDEQAHFELTEPMRKLRKQLKTARDCDLAIRSFFLTYHIDVVGTGLIEEILNAAGEKSFDASTFVNSRGAVVTCFDATRAFQHVFSKAYEHMVFAGTIKAHQIPELMMDKYDLARRKARKDAKKASKK